MNVAEQLWEFKHAPECVGDMILSSSYSDLLDSWISSGCIHNCLLVSSNPGCGKTTIVNLIKSSNKFVTMFVNASRETSIDIVRQNIRDFVATVSLIRKADQKIVLLDEADRLSPNALDALKGEIEINIDNARFVFTANRESAFPDPIKSRLKVLNFDKMFSDNKQEMYKQAMKRVCKILDSENVKYEPAAIATVIKKFAPDWRNVIKTCQLMSAYDGKICMEDISKIDSSEQISEIINNIKSKNFDAVRELSAKCVGNEIEVMNEFYKLVKSSGVIKNESKPALVLILADLNRHINSVPDPEIELMNAMVQMMSEIEFC